MSLPTPCPQFMTRAERDIYFKEVKVAKEQSQGQCLLQTDKSSMKTQNTTDHCNQKSRKRTRSSSSSTDKRKKRKSESEIKEEVLVCTAEPEPHSNAITEPCKAGSTLAEAEPVATVLNCDEEKPKKRKRNESKNETESELKKTKKSIDCSVSLYRRARTFSFPPLSGCTQYHGWQFWSGTEQMTQGQELQPQKSDKSTQTDNRQRNWSDVEKRIDQLVKQGRNEAKRRKVHSKIQIPVNCKRRRKTRRRKRKKRRLSIYSKR